MNLSESDIRDMRRQNESLATFIKDQTRIAASRHAQRRALVLRYPDLAVKLTQPPLEFSAPERWTGYIPPATTATGAINTTPRRPAFLALVAEAEKRAANPARHTEAEETAA